MKIINVGKRYEIYEDGIKTYDELPAGTYKIAFSPMSGFSFVKIDDFSLNEERVYGHREEKIEKVFKTYDKQNRSLGIILSGDKGIGKSLFTQMMAIDAIERDIPVIMVTQAIPGIVDFIDSIQQEVLVLFDEFEKVFTDETPVTQNDLLGLFDGISQQKRIYALTVNNLHQVNAYLLNRPGRLHYHFRFDYPTSEEITEYLKDNVDNEYHGEIEKVVRFGLFTKLNYDCLRAIATELNNGEAFETAINDLNILNIGSRPAYDIIVQLTDGEIIKATKQLDLFGNIRFEVCNKDNVEFEIRTNIESLVTENGELIAEGDNLKVDVDYDYSRVDPNVKLGVKRISITKAASDLYEYKFV